MPPGSDRRRLFGLPGHIAPPEQTSASLAGYRVEAWSGDRLLAHATTDAFGRFVLEWRGAIDESSTIAVRAFAPWKESAGEINLRSADLHSPPRLTFRAVPERRVVDRPVDQPPRRMPSSETVSDRDLSVFFDAVSAAVAGDLLRGDEATWVQQAIADLDRATALARGAIDGDFASLDMLRSLLRTARPFEIPLGPRNSLLGRRPAFGGMGDCFVSPRDPLPLIWGPVLLDGLNGRFDWSHRAVGFYNSRATPIEGAFGAAAGWAAGAMGLEDFAAAVRSFDPRRGGAFEGRPMPDLPEPGPCLSERNVCIGAFLFDLQQYGSQRVPDPPQVVSAVPDSICAGSGGTVTLLPPSGSQFPATAPTEWSLAIDGKAVAIQSWDPAEIVVEIPANVRPGCEPIRWVHVLNPEFVNHVRAIGEQCAPFFGGANAWVNFPPTIGLTAISISVVGTPRIRRFTADGLTSLVAEGCADVKLEWEADIALCAGSSAYLDVSLLKDGSQFGSALSPSDSLTVTDDATATYTLRVEAYDGATRCSVVEQSVQVQRYHAVRATVPQGNCVDAGGTLGVTVRVSCPAPSGGLPVTLTSSNAARIADGAVTIPEGSLEEYVELGIGMECGEATITVAAAGHQSASFTRLVSDYPQITAIMPAAVNACTPFQVWLDGSCLGGGAGQVSASLTDGSGATVAGTILQQQGSTRLQVEFPAMNPGQYPLAVTFCGKTGTANSLLTVNEKPISILEFTASPNQITSCPVAIKLSWRVDAARRVRILRAGVLMPGSERIRNQDCGVWEETFDDPQVQANTVQYTLEAFPTSGSPVKTAGTTVSAAGRKVFLSLSQSGGSMSFIYNANASDPLAFCQVKHGVITNVKSMAGRDLSLAHGGAGSTFIVINAGASTSAFNGQLVEGNWTAQVGGSSTGLPSQVTFQIDWAVP